MSVLNISNQCKLELFGMGFKVDKVLGSGCYGRVVRAFYKDHPERSPVAIKIIDKTKLQESDWVKVEREVEAMTQLTQGQAGKGEGHPNIIHFIQTLETSDYVYFVLECCKDDVLSRVQRTLGYEETEAKEMFRGLASAVHFAHSKGFIHRDIKLENLLLTETGEVRLADWGFARRYDEVLLREFCGSVHYAAPELCSGIAYFGPQVDVWSLGVTLFSLISARLPFFGPTQYSIARSIQKGFFPMPQSFSEELRDLLRRMLEVDPAKRATMEEILAHPWLSQNGRLEEGKQTLYRSFSAGPVLPTITSSPSPTTAARQEREKKGAMKLQSFWRNLVRRRANRMELEISKKNSSWK